MLTRSRRWALSLVFVTLLAGCTEDSPPPFVEPAHNIVYDVSAGGPVNAIADELDVYYTDSSGNDVEEHPSGPAWRLEITTKPGVSRVHLAAAGRATFGTINVKCTITVDGVRRSSGLSYSCQLELIFEELRPALDSAAASASASKASQSPTMTATTQSPSSKPPTSTGPDPCRYVKRTEVDSIASDAGRHDGLNTLRYPEAVKDRCRYVFMGQGTVTFWWVAREKSDSAQLRNVSELNYPASWFEFPEFASLEVQLPRGVFHVQTSFTILERDNVDQRKLAIGFARAALPRLR